MGQKMSNAPIYFALAQVRFNALSALDQYVPTIQDNLRKAGYPDFEKSFLGVLNISMGAAGPQAISPIPAMQPQSRYTFLNASRTSGFVLEQTMIYYHTTHYDRFEPFSDELFKGVEAVHQAATLAYSERIGVRCLDAICPRKNETLDKYIVPSILGIYDQLVPRTLVHSFSETRTKLGDSTLISKALVLQQDTEGNVAFPPELQPVQLKLDERFTKIKGIYGIIDTDCWLEERENFDISGLSKRLDALHTELRRSFDLMVQPYALEVWK